MVQKANLSGHTSSTLYRQFSNFQFKSSQVTQSLLNDPANLGFKVTRGLNLIIYIYFMLIYSNLVLILKDANQKVMKNSKLDAVDSFLNDTTLKFGGYYNANALSPLITNGIRDQVEFLIFFF